MFYKVKTSRLEVFLLILVSLCFLMSIEDIARAEENNENNAEAYLKKISSAYKELKTFYSEGTMTISTQVGEKSNTITIPITLAFERPNKFKIQFDHSGMGVTVVSDGKTMYTFLPGLDQYKKTSAPETMEDFTPDAFVKGNLEQSIAGHMIVSDDPLKDILNNAQSVEKDPDGELNEKKHAIVRILNKDKSVMSLYIDPSTSLLRQVVTDLSEFLKARIPEEQAPSELEAEIKEHYELIKAGEAIEPEVFTFIPPEDAREVATFKMPDRQSQNTSLKEGEKAPEFSLKGLDGKEYSLADQKGKVVLLDFWTTWCSPCVVAMPGIQKLHENLNKKGLVAWGINPETDIDRVAEFLENKGITYPTLLDKGGKVSGLYNVTAIPRCIIIDRNGMIAKDFTGYSKAQEQIIEESIKDLLKK